MNGQNNEVRELNIDDLKKWFYATLILLFLVLVVSIIYSLIWGPIKKYVDSLVPARVVSVTAEGKVTVEPDIAKVYFSVVSEGANPESLAEMNNKKMNTAIDFLKSQGIDGKDIKTTQYNLTPKYVYDDKNHRSYISGYQLTQTVLVKVKDLSQTAKIIGNLPTLGINQIGSISFEIDDPEKYLSEARDKAFEKAREKARVMAEKNGIHLGSLISFSEYQGGGPIPYYSALGKGAIESAQTLAPSIQPGSEEVSVNVSMTYEIK